MKRLVIAGLLACFLVPAAADAQSFPKPSGKAEAFLNFFNETYWNSLNPETKRRVDSYHWAQAVGAAYRIEIAKMEQLQSGQSRDYRKQYLESLWHDLKDYMRALGDTPQYRDKGYSGEEFFRNMNSGFWQDGLERSNPIIYESGLDSTAYRPSYFDSAYHADLPDDSKQATIIGTWVSKRGNDVMQISFRSDASFESANVRNGRSVKSWEGSYYISGNTITLNYKDADIGQETGRWTLVDNDTLILTYDTNQVTFKRRVQVYGY